MIDLMLLVLGASSPANPTPPAPVGDVCYFQGLDYSEAECGYPTLLLLIDNDPDKDAAGWYNGPRSVVLDLTSASQCQALCADHPECAFFAFELQDDAPTARCYLKAAYEDCDGDGYSALRRSPIAAAF